MSVLVDQLRLWASIVCAECGGPLDPEVDYVNHEPGCEYDLDDDTDWCCDCPDVCASCARGPQEPR